MLMSLKKRLRSIRFIQYIYSCWHALWGHNCVRGSRGNYIKWSRTYRSHVSVFFANSGNELVIEEGSRLSNCQFRIYGRGNRIRIGSDCNLNHVSFHLEDSGSGIILGRGVTIAGDTKISAIEGCGVFLGDDCMLSSEIAITNGDSHSILDATGKRINFSKDVVIGSHVWIAQRVTILKGTHIADGSIVGACTCVAGQHEKANSIIAGVPGRCCRIGVLWDRSII